MRLHCYFSGNGIASAATVKNHSLDKICSKWIHPNVGRKDCALVKSGDRTAGTSDGSANEPQNCVPGISGRQSEAYWKRQKTALDRARHSHDQWAKSRRQKNAGKPGQSWTRVTFSLPRIEARQEARAFLEKYPKAAYWSEVESWRELPGDIIEFTMRRLPSAD